MSSLFYLSVFLILVHNILYWLFLFFLSMFLKTSKTSTFETFPSISLIVAAHNEEKIILQKIKNSLSLEYPEDKIEFIFVSDGSTDNTNTILSEAAKHNKQIQFIPISPQGGKLNALNKAASIAKGEVLVFSDANTMLDGKCIVELTKVLSEESVACACGKIIFTNPDETRVSYSESLYWKLENMMKEKESAFYSITALNGGIYAIRKNDYVILNPLYSHDLCFPLILGKKRRRTIFVKTALAFERSGTTTQDESKRKRRMYGRIYHFIARNPSLFFSPLSYNSRFFFMVFCHRTIRYMLPFLHILLFVTSFYLYGCGVLFKTTLLLQLFFVTVALVAKLTETKTKPLFILYYYLLFLFTMLMGFLDFITGRLKPFWEIAQSTRS